MNWIEPDPNPKRRLFMKSASSAASGSGQQQVQRPATELETKPPTEVSKEIDDGNRGALPSFNGPNTTRRIAEKPLLEEAQPSSSAVAIITQDGVDNEDRECRTSREGQLHGLVSHGSCAQMGKTIEPLRGSIAEQSRCLEHEESLSLDSCQAFAREDSHQLVDCDAQGSVERGICSAASKTL